jgi:hypothetical protein
MVADPLLTVAYDEAAFSSVMRFYQFDALLQLEMGPAMRQIGGLIVESMIANTWIAFANPTGNLASHISAVYPSVLEAYIVVDVPYAWRMEAGFNGIDSLGRLYNEPGKPYAVPAITDYQEAILQDLSDGVARTIARMGGKI